MTIMLNGSDLTVTQVVAAARHGEAVALAPAAIAAMRQARTVVEEVLGPGEPVYGLTTGVGERKAYLLDPAERQRFNHRLVLNHRIAQGDAAPADVVRGAMLCLANSYAKGVTGVRPELAEMIVTLLNEGFAPPVRRLGSIGQGDLGPMADLAHGLITRSGFEVAENEGLALVSSNAFTTAWACIATADAAALLAVFDVAGALDLEAFGANLTCLHPVIEQTRPFPGLAATLGQLRLLLAGSYLWQPGAARFLQDPLTFRCIPHIHGAARDALDYAQNDPAGRAQFLAEQPRGGGARAPDRLGRQLRHRPARRRARLRQDRARPGGDQRERTRGQAVAGALFRAVDRPGGDRGLAGRRAVRAGGGGPGDHRGGPHAGPSGLLRAGQLGEGGGHRGPGHDGAAVGARWSADMVQLPAPGWRRSSSSSRPRPSTCERPVSPSVSAWAPAAPSG